MSRVKHNGFLTNWKTNVKVLPRGFVGQGIWVQHQLRDEHRLAAVSFRLKHTNTHRPKLNTGMDVLGKTHLIYIATVLL